MLDAPHYYDKLPHGMCSRFRCGIMRAVGSRCQGGETRKRAQSARRSRTTTPSTSPHSLLVTIIMDNGSPCTALKSGATSSRNARSANQLALSTPPLATTTMSTSRGARCRFKIDPKRNAQSMLERSRSSWDASHFSIQRKATPPFLRREKSAPNGRIFSPSCFAYPSPSSVGSHQDEL